VKQQALHCTLASTSPFLKGDISGLNIMAKEQASGRNRTRRRIL